MYAIVGYKQLYWQNKVHRMVPGPRNNTLHKKGPHYAAQKPMEDRGVASSGYVDDQSLAITDS